MDLGIGLGVSHVATTAVGGGGGSSPSALYMPGVLGNYASLADDAAYAMGALDHTLRIRVRLVGTGPAQPDIPLAGQWAGDQNGWLAIMEGETQALLNTSSGTGADISRSTGKTFGGTDYDLRMFKSGTNVTFAWRDMDLDVDLRSDVGMTTTNTAGTLSTTNHDSTSPVQIGQVNTIVLEGYIYQFSLEIDGTGVINADFSAQAPGTESFEESDNGAIVTINTSGGDPAAIVAAPS